MMKLFMVLPVSCSFLFAAVPDNPLPEQEKVTPQDSVHFESRVKPILTIDDHQFRDLNDNGRLDAYEDKRLPVETPCRESDLTYDKRRACRTDVL